MQAVLKRKTEEAEAARRKLRELTELQARVRRDKQAYQQGSGAGDPSGGPPLCTVVLCSFSSGLAAEAAPLTVAGMDCGKVATAPVRQLYAPLLAV